VAREGFNLFQAFHALSRAENPQDQHGRTWRELKRKRQEEVPDFSALVQSCLDEAGPRETQLLKALAALEVATAARTVRLANAGPNTGREEKETIAQEQRQQDEQWNKIKEEQRGNLRDCGCCFDTMPLNRMVHCAGNVTHVCAPSNESFSWC